MSIRIITPGHCYVLPNFDSPGHGSQTIQFIEKEPIEGAGNGAMRVVHDGTTNEDLLCVLIDRMQHLQGQFPCRENALVITKLEESLMWLEKRTADRKARNVEGKHLD